MYSFVCLFKNFIFIRLETLFYYCLFVFFLPLSLFLHAAKHVGLNFPENRLWDRRLAWRSLECSVLQDQALGEWRGGRRERSRTGQEDLTCTRWWELMRSPGAGTSSHQGINQLLDLGFPGNMTGRGACTGWQQLLERSEGKYQWPTVLGTEDLFSSECLCSDRAHRAHSAICHTAC